MVKILDFSDSINNYTGSAGPRGSTLNYFGIFAKYWEQGKVKTRLASKLGPQTACDVYYAILRNLIETPWDLARSHFLAFSPADKHGEFESLIDGNDNRWSLTPQSDGSLGTRMAHFFKQAFALGAKRVVLIGSDCPDVSTDDIAAAFETLGQSDVVLGPTFDGGYYLVGMSNQFHDIFSGITYSTESVFQETLDLAARNNIQCGCLDNRNDIDELEDLNQLIEAMLKKKNSGALDSRRVDLLDELIKICGDPPIQPQTPTGSPS